MFLLLISPSPSVVNAPDVVISPQPDVVYQKTVDVQIPASGSVSRTTLPSPEPLVMVKLSEEEPLSKESGVDLKALGLAIVSMIVVASLSWAYLKGSDPPAGQTRKSRVVDGGS